MTTTELYYTLTIF